MNPAKLKVIDTPGIRWAGLLLAAIVFVWALFPAGSSAFAWGPDGHRIIGHIAELHLSPEAKKMIREKFNIKSLAGIANWADEVKKKRFESRWHYSNIQEGKWTYKKSRDCPHNDCVVEKVQEYTRRVERGGLSRKKRKEAVMYLVHFMGDLHQPLHLGNKKDRGGNRIRLFYRGRKTNLHALWDGGLIYRRGQSLLEYALNIDRRISEEDRAGWAKGTVIDWANESRKIALADVYSQGNEGVVQLDKNKISIFREIIDRRLAQAGIRLAQVLNRAVAG
jgi:hypothetical protein